MSKQTSKLILVLALFQFSQLTEYTIDIRVLKKKKEKPFVEGIGICLESELNECTKPPKLRDISIDSDIKDVFFIVGERAYRNYYYIENKLVYAMTKKPLSDEYSNYKFSDLRFDTVEPVYSIKTKDIIFEVEVNDIKHKGHVVVDYGKEVKGKSNLKIRRYYIKENDEIKNQIVIAFYLDEQITVCNLETTGLIEKYRSEYPEIKQNKKQSKSKIQYLSPGVENAHVFNNLMNKMRERNEQENEECLDGIKCLDFLRKMGNEIIDICQSIVTKRIEYIEEYKSKDSSTSHSEYGDEEENRRLLV